MKIEDSWFIKAMVKATADMWLKGWNERNGGNVSLRLPPEDVEYFRSSMTENRVVEIGETVAGLGGQYFLVTASGEFLRNVQLDPEEHLGVIEIAADEKTARVLWGFRGEGIPTSEFSAHLKSHRSRQQITNGACQVIMHCHATNLIALSYVLDLSAPAFTRALWEMSTECLVVFPDGMGVLPWLVPGTAAIGEATANAMMKHPLVLWPYHGIFGSGATLDEAFGLIDTAEKAAEVLVKVLSMGGIKHSITTQELKALAERFHVQPMPEALAMEKWIS
ncbi:MAG: rhamnulose-1-phosphate aldolase [Terracidiphilus sp.]|jgi:rhamnulose-1-phosphate aldolase